MNAPAHPALAPARLGPLALKNRLVVAPLTRVSTRGDGAPTDEIIRYYEAYAQGGFGLIISEGTYTDDRFSQGYENQVGMVTPAHVAGWRRVTEAVHAAGGKMLCQLMHAGALSQHLTETIAPSAVRPKGEKMPAYVGQGQYPVPKAMDEADIEQTIAGFVAAAGRARDAGFDGVEIHGANGYLIDQFITTYTNQRADRWGGDAAARAGFAGEIVRRVRSDAPPEFVVGLRLSQGKVNDHHWRWPGGREDGAAIFHAVSNASPDYLHIASEGRNFSETADLGGVTISRLAREISGRPVIANGALDAPDIARRALDEGDADFIALGRAAIANPDWPNRLRDGALFRPWRAEMIEPEATLANTARFLRAEAGR